MGCAGAQLSTYKVIRRGAKNSELTALQSAGSTDSAIGTAGHHPTGGDVANAKACFEDVQETWMLSEFCDCGADESPPSLNHASPRL